MEDSQVEWECLDNMDNLNKLHTGEWYLPGDSEIMNLQLKCLEKM